MGNNYSGKFTFRQAAIFAVIMGLSACAGGEMPLDAQMGKYGLPHPTPGHYVHCWGNGCLHSVALSLDSEEWQEIRDIFDPQSQNPGEERERMALAIARLEQLTGERAITGRDIGGSFRGYGLKGQQDCIDEMINTTTYLTMMRDDGLIRFHNLDKRLTNGWFEVSGWPHTAGSVKDTQTGEIFVIDSWWLDNGNKPYILPKEQWKTGNWEKSHQSGEWAPETE
ncbi:MAG: hypothetical protein EP340_02345 [Alphaproteobacteria bacterium]|nr:MAG: hypothetical protein EP340_02345 [Alphaproteobacteria bacterium]